MAKLVGNKKKNLSIITQPWFVIVVVISCFGILTPKIFMPLFRQITGSGGGTSSSSNNYNSMPHNMRPMRGPGPRDHGAGSDGARSSPHFGGRGGGGPQPAYAPQQSQSSNSKSMLSFLLPVYATGIGLYMIYTLFKVFNKNDDEDQDKKNHDLEQDEEEFEANKTNNYKFKENSTVAVSSTAPSSNVRWDPDDGQFKYVNGTAINRFQKMSEESEDELTDYARYKNLDPEYVEFLKHKRRLKREESALAKTKKASLKTDEISLSPGSGLTSITNTNVLMNETLERMKHSLNKINNQLIQVENKGSPLDDPELENLRIQLTQTELQMAKIMNIVNSVSTTIQQTPPSPPTPPPPPSPIDQDTELDDQAELECLQRQVEMIKLAVSKTETKSNKINKMKNKKSKNSSSANKQVYEKIKHNITVAEQLLRKRNTNKTESQATPEQILITSCSSDSSETSVSSISSSSSAVSSESTNSSTSSSSSSSDAAVANFIQNHYDQEEEEEGEDQVKKESDNEIETLSTQFMNRIKNKNV